VIALDLASPHPSRPLAGDLHAVELVTGEEFFLGSHVRALTKLLAEKDAYTEQHTRRVALLAVEVGERLGLSRTRLRRLAVGALVHDMGKLSVPDAILNKPAALTDDEYALVRKHPDWGAELLAGLGGFPAPVRQLVRNHHERLDGHGYPRGLKADEITLDARILTVCDVYDALITSRVYRPAWTRDQALGLLRKESGTAFDPRCIATLELLTHEQAAVPSPACEAVVAGLALA
jgi:HD-GYP domain-containing protein (c-di-GMP phosphodiesterase class II)